MNVQVKHQFKCTYTLFYYTQHTCTLCVTHLSLAISKWSLFLNPSFFLLGIQGVIGQRLGVALVEGVLCVTLDRLPGVVVDDLVVKELIRCFFVEIGVEFGDGLFLVCLLFVATRDRGVLRGTSTENSLSHSDSLSESH